MKKVVKKVIKSTIHPKRTVRLIRESYNRWEINRRRREDYIRWFDNYLRGIDINSQRKEIKGWTKQPLISVLIPTYNTNPQHLRECLDSVISQSYESWEVCISDDASSNEETKSVIRDYTKRYKNIHATFNKKNGHIAVSSNVALSMAHGEFVSLLDHDDLLLPNALSETVKAINQDSNVDLVYSDEDKIEDDTVHVEPFFKPDWSPDFLSSCNYITHFATIRKTVMDDIGGFRDGTQGAQDWDLFLRIAQKTSNIYHIPKILYTWRKSPTSTAMSADSKPYAYLNQHRVLCDDIVARGENAYIKPHAALGFWRKNYVVEKPYVVSIIIPTKNNLKLIKQCVNSILEKTTYPYFEIVIVDTGSDDEKVWEYYASLLAKNMSIKVEKWDRPFNFSSVCNFGAKRSTGDYLVFLNNDTKIITDDWIQGMLEHAQREDIGMVGVKLLFPDETIQHAGVVLSQRDVAFHPFYGVNPRDDVFLYIYANNIRNVSAVTAACSMVSRDKFEQVGGFDDRLRVTYNDVDLNLKLLKAGYKNLYTPYVELFHYESMSVGRIATSDRDHQEFEEAKLLMQKRWGDELARDKYYNENFQPYGPGYLLPRT